MKVPGIRWLVAGALALGLASAGCDDDAPSCPALPDAGPSGGFGAWDATAPTPSADVWDGGASAPDAADPGTDGAPSPGETGAPCLSNENCFSGYCVESTQGYVCSALCGSGEQCPDGWGCRAVVNNGVDVVFICLPNVLKLCHPCLSDITCGAGVCAELAEGTFCTQPCDHAPCPEGFTCVEAQASDWQAVKRCEPANGSCTCRPETEGGERSCQVTNDLGTCFGVEACDPTSGWVGCTASAAAIETCNGLDDDCNGKVDDTLPAAKPCEQTNDLGTCQGEATCLGPLGYVCNAQMPAPEACDNQDNDCDGQTDEGFVDPLTGYYATEEHCGSCHHGCDEAIANGTGTCETTATPPECVVTSCDEGFVKVPPYQCIPSLSKLCAPCTADAHCVVEGAKCLDYGAEGTFCGLPCADDGGCDFGYHCNPDEGQCRSDTGTCSCDGTNTSLLKGCQVKWDDPDDPSKPSITCYGSQPCTTEGWGACQLPSDACDGVDNDCDGVVDEAYVDDDGRYVTDEHCGACNLNCATLSTGDAAGVCDTAPPIPTCAIACAPGFEDVDGNPANGCECQLMPGDDLPDGSDTDCDGMDGSESLGLFVSKEGDDGGPGTRDMPMRTITAAIERALSDGVPHVYVATGVYVENVRLQPKVHVYGGYTSDFGFRDPALAETVVFGTSPTADLPGAVTAKNIAKKGKQTAVLDGFTIFGYHQKAQSASSYAVYLLNVDDSLALTHNVIVAGAGGDGPPGSAGQDGLPGTDGDPGLDALDHAGQSCNPVTQSHPGGAAGTMSCGGGDVSGGAGGTSTCPSTFSPQPGTTETGKPGKGPGSSAGAGGKAGWDAEVISFAGCTCLLPDESAHGQQGEAGHDGSQGKAGAGCPDGAGSTTGGLWSGFAGQAQ